MMTLSEINLCVIGLGYVGLPLTVEFAKGRQVIGFDINEKRIQALLQGQDDTLELAAEQILFYRRYKIK
jgi:UDP-N-acetyl-D-glucosamine/UDP-N-acetyl-D-galactosamine dehydrogenase